MNVELPYLWYIVSFCLKSGFLTDFEGVSGVRVRRWLFLIIRNRTINGELRLLQNRSKNAFEAKGYMFCLSNRRRFLACIRQGWGGGLIWAYFVRGSGRCRAFVFFFFKAWAPPLRGKYVISRDVVAILQILFLPKWFLDQRNHPWLRDDSLSWAIYKQTICNVLDDLGKILAVTPWSRNEVCACRAVQWNPALKG